MGLGAKKGFLQDSLEKIAEVGAGTVSHGVKAVTQTTDPSSYLRSLYGIPESTTDDPDDKLHDKSTPNLEKKHGGSNHTPLDKQKLEKKYQEQDAASLAEARRQFKWFQNQEQEYLAKKRREHQQLEHQKRQQEEEKKKKMEEEHRKKQSEGDYEARGKQKLKLGQPRRKATTELHPETKAGGAK